MQELRETWVYLSASPLLHLTLTMAAFVLASFVYRKARLNPLLNPVLLSVVAIVALLYLSGTSYDTSNSYASPRWQSSSACCAGR